MFPSAIGLGIELCRTVFQISPSSVSMKRLHLSGSTKCVGVKQPISRSTAPQTSYGPWTDDRLPLLRTSLLHNTVENFLHNGVPYPLIANTEVTPATTFWCDVIMSISSCDSKTGVISQHLFPTSFCIFSQHSALRSSVHLRIVPSIEISI